MKLEVWPRWASPKQEIDNQPFPGWPIQIRQEDNYGRKRLRYLDPIQLDGQTLVKVIDQDSGELLYALKPKAGMFRPFVFQEEGNYNVILEK